MQLPTLWSPRLSMQEYLEVLPVLDRHVLLFCCTQERPMNYVCEKLGISPGHVTRILMRTLTFIDAMRDAGTTEDSARLAGVLERQTKLYLEGQEFIDLQSAWMAGEMGVNRVSYGVN